MHFDAPVRAKLIATPDGAAVDDGAEVSPDATQVPPARDEQFDVDDEDGFDLPFDPPFGLTDEQAVLAGGGGLLFLLILLAAI